MKMNQFHIQKIVVSDGKNTTVTVENGGVTLNVNILVVGKDEVSRGILITSDQAKMLMAALEVISRSEINY